MAATELLFRADSDGTDSRNSALEDWSRVRELWDWRLEKVSEPTASADEFITYLMYINETSEQIPFDETRDLLSASVPAFATTIDGWENLQSYLLKQIPDHTAGAIEIYYQLVNEDDWPWLRLEDDARELVKAAIGHDHDRTHELGLDIAERIAEREDRSFAGFIE
jgi:hypothetical protein